MTGKLIIYGHRRYGQRVREQAKRAGLDFIVAGRDAEKVRAASRPSRYDFQRRNLLPFEFEKEPKVNGAAGKVSHQMAGDDRLMHECFRAGLKSPHIVQEAANEATILSLVSCRLGVAFVSSATRWRCPASVVVLPVTDLNLPLPLALIWRKDNVSPLLAKFVAGVRQLPEVEAFTKH